MKSEKWGMNCFLHAEAVFLVEYGGFDFYVAAGEGFGGLIGCGFCFGCAALFGQGCCEAGVGPAVFWIEAEVFTEGGFGFFEPACFEEYVAEELAGGLLPVFGFVVDHGVFVFNGFF